MTVVDDAVDTAVGRALRETLADFPEPTPAELATSLRQRESKRRHQPHRRLAAIAGVAAAATILIVGLLALQPGERAQVLDTADETPVEGPTTVPGAGVVDQWQGPMTEAPPFEPPSSGVEGIVPGQPIPVIDNDDHSLTGYVDWDDLYPTVVPTSEETPAPMVPVRDVSGKQIAWWASPLGWMTFEEVTAPGFDYLAEYSAWLAQSRQHQRENPRADLGQP